jgi:hypothetical protein
MEGLHERAYSFRETAEGVESRIQQKQRLTIASPSKISSGRDPRNAPPPAPSFLPPPSAACLPTSRGADAVRARGERRARTECAARARRRSGGDVQNGSATPLGGAVVPAARLLRTAAARARGSRAGASGGHERNTTRGRNGVPGETRLAPRLAKRGRLALQECASRLPADPAGRTFSN